MKFAFENEWDLQLATSEVTDIVVLCTFHVADSHHNFQGEARYLGAVAVPFEWVSWG